MLRQSSCLLCLLTLCLTLAVVASPLRADEPTRLEISPDGPITTLEDARLRVRELKKKHPDQPIEVLIKGGVYPVSYTHLTLPTKA